MSIQFLPGKLKGTERKTIIQTVQKEVQAAALGAIRPLFTDFCEAELTAKLGREKGEPRRVSGQAREIDWQCGHCGCRDANQFMRDGHYRRALETGWGHVEGVQIPMLECQDCGHDVICTYTILEKYRRVWLDMDQQALFGSSLCQSLRHLSQAWSATLGGSVGLRTINERINQLAPLLQQARTEPITDVRAVIPFDGIWLRVQTPTQEVKCDTRQRQRKVCKGKKVLLLLALGFWTDGSGKREIVDWEIAESESQAAWERLVHRLWERGVQPEKGLQAVIRDGNGELGEAVAFVYGSTVVEQRCLFHKLRNVADKAREDLTGQAQQETRQQLLDQARAIHQAEDAPHARARLKAFVQTWQARAPKAVATLQCDFEQTIAYYALEGGGSRTRSHHLTLGAHQSRVPAQVSQVCCFGSLKGAEVTISLHVRRLNAQWAKQTWWDASQALFFDFLDLHP